MEIIKYLKAHTCIQRNKSSNNKNEDDGDDDDDEVVQVDKTIQIECTMMSYLSYTQNIYQTEFVARLCLIILDITGTNLCHAFNT